MAFALLEGVLIQFLRTLKIQTVFSFHLKINVISMISVVVLFLLGGGFHNKSWVSDLPSQVGSLWMTPSISEIYVYFQDGRHLEMFETSTKTSLHKTVYFMNFLVQHCRIGKTFIIVLEIDFFFPKNTLRNLPTPTPTPLFPQPPTRKPATYRGVVSWRVVWIRSLQRRCRPWNAWVAARYVACWPNSSNAEGPWRPGRLGGVGGCGWLEWLKMYIYSEDGWDNKNWMGQKSA